MLPLSNAAKRWLIETARQAVWSASMGEEPAVSAPPADLPASDREWLERPQAAFVTLTKHGKLRGCVGHVASDRPLVRTAVEMAAAAALEDSRFDPVQPEEVPALHIEISVLSPFFPITPEAIEPGRHGLAIEKGLRRGLLLPQVAVHCHWTAQQFLEGVCDKAGLPRDAWKHGASLEAFTAEVIAEEEAEAA
jgi:AmmeMemoRadiSam system protein A